MIATNQIIPLMLEACPSFQAAWDDHLREYDNPLIYIALADFARHLLELHQSGKVEAIRDAAQVIERLHIEGDANVREAATIGLLESIQCVWPQPELFRPYLLPQSTRWWQSLNDFWDGKIRFVGDGL
jgi:hypothetical protein